MPLKETEGSLRAYFLLAGVISILLAIRDLGAATTIPLSQLPTDWMIAIYVPVITRLGIGAAYVLASLLLKPSLRTGAGWIKHVLVLGLVLMGTNAVVIVLVLGIDIGRDGLIGAIIGVAITIYLYRSVTRLSAEAVARAASPPPPAVV